jgi:galactokinase
MIDQCLEKKSVEYRRCRYVVEENERLLSACQDLQNGNLSAFGKKMFLTHDGLSKGYEVSCEELDFLVDQVRNNPAVLGARMMGGGFGGCMVTLLQEDSFKRVVTEVSDAFRRNFAQSIKVYEVQIEDGTSVLG